MSSFQGRFVWYELMTNDLASAEAFYRDVAGWTTQDAGLPDRRYTILSAGAAPIGGAMTLPAEAAAMGARPGWIGYVAVDDVDAHAAKVQAAKGAVHRPPEDIPGVGRFAVVADPQGAAFILFKGAGDPPPGDPPAQGTPGHVGWHELVTTDGEAGFAFYAELFGWTKAEAVDMGSMGTYQIFAIQGEQAGGMMKKPDANMPSAWLYYVNVDTIDAAAKRVTDRGGQILNGPMEVPGGSWIVQGMDPQGAVFALVGPKG